MAKHKQYKVADLFCGAGGLSLGFEDEGDFHIVAAVENNKHARETYPINHKDLDIAGHFPEDVREVNFGELDRSVDGIDVVIGGPPCQGFSNANRQHNHLVNMNNQLVKEYFRAVRQIMPKAFVMENVGMLKSATHRFFDSAMDTVEVHRLGIPMKDDSVFISGEPDRFNVLRRMRTEPELIDEYQIDSSLFYQLNVLRKKRSDEARHHFLKNHKRQLLKAIEEDSSAEKNNLLAVVPYLEQESFSDGYTATICRVLDFQKSIQNLQELQKNKILFEWIIVDGNLSAQVQSYSVLDYITHILGDQYQVSPPQVYEATNFGVPQRRKRFLLIGIRSDLAPEGHPVDFLPLIRHNSGTAPTVGDAIADLENVPASDTLDGPLPRRKIEPRSAYAESLLDPKTDKIYNHVVPKSTATAIQRFKKIEPGKNFHSLPDTLKTSYAVPGRTQNTIYLRLKYEQPSGTVVNVRKSMWIHPIQDRGISVREAARLQSFPDSYHFVGPKDSQYQQVGNAVPPLMAQGIAEFVDDLLN